MIRTITLAGFITGFTALAANAHPPLKLDPLFTDHMVLQRGKPLTIRGEGGANTVITVRFGSVVSMGRIDENGKWSVTLPAVPEGTKGVLEVTAAGGESIRLSDVVAGDVILCSGQSNMDLPVSDTSYPKRTAEEASGKDVRVLKIKRTASVRPDNWIVPETGWAPAGPDSLPGFSAACWHMGKNLSASKIGAPLGLIQASWGGTSIEDWLSAEALQTLPARTKDVARLRAYDMDAKKATAELVSATDSWAQTADPAATKAEYQSPGFDDKDWPELSLPGTWERSGIAALRSFDGLMWFRRSIDLDTAQAGGVATLRLGRIDERDQVWVNGHVIGASLLGSENRAYTIPAGLLKAGRNIIVIRVLDERGAGGLMGKAGDLKLEPSTGESVDLGGMWRYMTGSARKDWKIQPPFVPWAAPRGISMLWNGMIAPLNGFPLKGVVWYQGETNTSEAKDYAALLTLWRSSWRQFFKDPALPVVIAQLPGYGPRSAVPADNDWAQLREAQRLTAAADPKTGLAVLIDLGVPYDIHPAHKEEVGARLSEEMLRVGYDRKIMPSPAPLSVDLTPDGIRVRFRDTGGSLIAFGSHDATTFEICTAVACRFVAARVDGDSVLLPADAAAQRVRYAWQGSPPVNLFGKSGLPVVPFTLPLPAVRP